VYTDVLLSLEVEEAGMILLGLDMVETCLDTSSQDAESALEV
jgi:hypothetical protein